MQQYTKQFWRNWKINYEFIYKAYFMKVKQLLDAKTKRYFPFILYHSSKLNGNISILLYYQNILIKAHNERCDGHDGGK